MGCSCGKKNGQAVAQPQSYVVTQPDGSTIVKRTEVEAAATARRVGGTYRAQ